MSHFEFDHVAETLKKALQGSENDPAWLSVLIGRLGAALGAGAVVFAASSAVWGQLQTLVQSGATQEEALQVLTSVGLLVDSSDAAIGAIGAIVALVLPLISKYREHRKSKR